MNKNTVSVVLPCFNESGNIIPLIDTIHRELEINKWQHEIIIVDDNSPDKTYDIVLQKQYRYVKAFLRTKEPSFAKSIRYGIEQATGDYIVVMDSDFNHQPKYLPVLLENLKYYDCVVASRFVYGGKMSSKARHLASWFFNIFVRILTRHYITDSLFGYFAIKRNVLEKLKFDDIFWGYGEYCIRLMYYLQKNKTTILQIPAVLGERIYGKGNSRFVKIFVQYTKATIGLMLGGKRYV
ncbi:MAG: Dolichyl-phosphate beta-D-mannosyltransferase [uncultured bacterium]|nr:MAG: Dolichyl-phosphate beta-D-mannosyltransferase [uncultured bacterium]